MTDHDRVEYGLFVKLKLILLQHRQALTGRDLHRSLVRFYLTTEDLQKSTFSGTIRTDHTIAVPLHETDVDLIEKNPFSVCQCDIPCSDHIWWIYGQELLP